MTEFCAIRCDEEYPVYRMWVEPDAHTLETRAEVPESLVEEYNQAEAAWGVVQEKLAALHELAVRTSAVRRAVERKP